MSGFADGFSQVAGTILQAKRLKADRDRDKWLQEQRASEMEAEVKRGEQQRQFQKELLAEQIAADLSRAKQERLWKMEDDFSGMIDRSQDRSLREKLINAQAGAYDRQGGSSGRPPPTAFERQLSDLGAFDQARDQGIANAIEALKGGDMDRIFGTQQRLATLAGMDPANQAPRPPMASVEVPYGGTELEPGKAKFQLPLDQVQAQLRQPQMNPAQQPGNAADAALQWARQNPQDPRAALILKKLGMQ